jgi:hypothetical protein
VRGLPDKSGGEIAVEEALHVRWFFVPVQRFSSDGSDSTTAKPFPFFLVLALFLFCFWFGFN